jgi:hypothetical protein
MRLRERFSRTWWLALLFGQVGVAVAQDRPPEPVFEAWTAGGCPADAGLRYDVSAIGGADRIRWQLRRGAGTLPVASGTEMGVSGRARMDFRAYGPVLEGSEYLGRIRAFQGDTPALDAWSNNSRWSATAAPDGMYSVADASQSGQYQVRLQWTLGGAIASCADRIHYEIKKDAPFTSTSGPDASAQAGSFGTVTGNQAIALPQGPGDYYVRLVARHGTDTPAHDVGKWGAAKRITIQPPQTVSCDDLAPTGMFSVTPVIQASAPQYRLKIDWTLTGGLAACADRITYELMKGHAFASDALDPLTYMAGTFSGTSGSSLVFLPEGADDYWVRILARQGGDTRNNDVGLRSAAVQVSVSATRHEVAIKVIDDAASKCAGSTVPASGATVRLVSADGNQQSAVADVEGMARLSVLGGSYAMSATRQSCGSRSEDLTVNAKLDTSIGLPGCVADGADLAVLLSSSSTSPVGGQTYPLTVTLRSVGTGAASPASVLVERREQGASAATRLFKKDVPQICRGDEQTLSTTDPTPEAGKTYTYVARLNLRATDANPNNNSASRAVAFPTVEVAANEPASTSPDAFPTVTSGTQRLFNAAARPEHLSWAFDFYCGPGRVLTGVRVRAGEWIDRIERVYCRAIDAQGRWSGPQTNYMVWPGVPTGQVAGSSSGGNTVNLKCSTDRAVIGVRGTQRIAAPVVGNVLTSMFLVCGRLGERGQSQLSADAAVAANQITARAGRVAEGDQTWQRDCPAGRPATSLLAQESNFSLYILVADVGCGDPPLPPQVVTTAAPAARSSVTARRPTFRWAAAPLAKEYRICLAGDEIGRRYLDCPPGSRQIAWTTGTSWTPSADLPFSRERVNWVVQACDDRFCTPGIGSFFEYSPE